MPKRKHDGSGCERHPSRTSRVVDDDFEALALLESQPQLSIDSMMLPGPTSPQSLCDWPCDILARLCSVDERRDILFKLLEVGGLHTTDYSGFDSPRETVTQVLVAVGLLLKVVRPQKFVRSCDLAKLPQKTLTWASYNLDDGQSCVLSNIEACLSAQDLQTLDSMIPHQGVKKLSKDQKAEVAAAYQDMLGWLIENREEVFPRPLQSPCLLHGLCPVHPPRGLDDKALRINWAGTSCVGWTSVGKQDRFSHCSERVHAVWLAQRVILEERGLEDGFFQDSVIVFLFVAIL